MNGKLRQVLLRLLFFLFLFPFSFFFVAFFPPVVDFVSVIKGSAEVFCLFVFC